MKLVYGVGVNDSEKPTRVNGVLIPSYTRWTDMLKRCYSGNELARRPTYVSCSVHPDWFSFSAFDEWFTSHYVDGYHLDKDLLVLGNKVYSESTCIFVPQWLNSFVIEGTSARGKYLLGVSWHEHANKFRTQCRNPITKKNECVGYFCCELEAHEKWKERKLQHVENMKTELDALDVRLYPNLKQKYK